MDAKAAASAYRRSAIETAPPLKIIRLLYEGALRHLDRAAAVGVARPDPAYTENLARADAIVTELRLALDPAQGDPQIALELERLYVFVEDKISAAMHKRDLASIEHARGVLATLLEAWVEIDVAESQAA
jgi:flagellar protein FliS